MCIRDSINAEYGSWFFTMSEEAAAAKQRGNELYKARDFHGAIQAYTEAINLDPANPTYYSNRSAAWQACNNLQETLRDCVKAVQLDPGFLKCLQRGLKVASTLGHLDQALEFAHNLAAADPAESGAPELLSRQRELYLEGCVDLEKKEYGRSLNKFAQVQDLGLSFRDLVLKQAECFLGLGNGSQTQRLTLQLIRENPDDVDAYTLRGMALYLCDNVDQAVKHLQEALRRDPEHKLAMRQLKTVRGLQRLHKEIKDFMFKRNFEEAAGKLSEALDLDLLFGMRLQFISDRAVCYLRTYQDEACVADCTEALEMQPDTVSVLNTLISAYLHMASFDKALETAEHLMEVSSTEESHKRLSEVKFEQKKAARPDYYAWLEVNRIASMKEIKEGYHKRAMELHPDKHPEDKEAAENKFKEMQVAYEVLSTPEMRELYDKGHDYESIQEQLQRRQHGHGHSH
eukprot:TRINITY_DN1782_c0_g2_i2.p1 TRINITY_DN1782_c0_g2~~TRINITY_DN1782_c0_g2_i2.p1  ORF type:complete len:471 (+),score=118.40 TRINITY_DN1782_c0_g2_i2:41-1414(+)